MEELIVYRSYDNFDRCQELVHLLTQNDIPFETEQIQKAENQPFKGSYSGNLLFIVKIKKADLERANTLYEFSLAKTEDHYFSHFSNNELEQVLIDSEEWAAGDILIAHLLLAQRNIKPDESKLEFERMKKREVFHVPQKGNTLNILLAFLLPYFAFAVLILHAPFLFCFFFALAGGAIGINFRFNYRRDGEGTKYTYYDARTRQWGFYAWLHAFVIIAFLIYTGISSHPKPGNDKSCLPLGKAAFIFFPPSAGAGT
jgi:hypothetical protein